MYNKHEKIIESEYERLKPELTEQVRENYNEYKESTLHCFSTFKQRMVDTEAVIINGTKQHKEIDLLSKKEVVEWIKTGDVKRSNVRILFENDQVGFEHSIVTFNDGNKEAVMSHLKYKDGKIIHQETGATKLPK